MTRILGAHMSIAGGLHRAAQAAAEFGMDTVQIFTASPHQWPDCVTRATAPPARATQRSAAKKSAAAATTAAPRRAKPPESTLAPEAAQQFRQAIAELGLQQPIAHDSYLINLASPDEKLWRDSIAAFCDELRRADQLGVAYVVTHPGAYTSSSEEAGLTRVAAALDEVHRQTRGVAARCLLESTAGQGTTLGWKFEHLAEILAQVRDPDRLGVCLDTCHLFAAGYPLATLREYRRTFKALDQTVGLSLVRAIHLNDSVKGLGSRVDRHAHIGRGEIGLDAFRHLLRDDRLARVPMYLETPKGKHGREEWDAINLRTLRELCE